MQPIRIRPEYTLLFNYNLQPGVQEIAYRFVVTEFVPKLQKMNVYMYNAWHIAYGDMPEWQVEFITEHLDHLRQLFDLPEWERMERRLKGYTTRYSCRIINYRGVFQF